MGTRRTVQGTGRTVWVTDSMFLLSSDSEDSDSDSSSSGSEESSGESGESSSEESSEGDARPAKVGRCHMKWPSGLPAKYACSHL